MRTYLYTSYNPQLNQMITWLLLPDMSPIKTVVTSTAIILNWFVENTKLIHPY